MTFPNSGSSDARAMIFFLFRKFLGSRISHHWFSGTSGEKSHAQFHVTSIYKVTLDSYSVELYLLETLDT